MAKYTLIHGDDVESKGSNGTFKMFKEPLDARQVTLSLRTFPARSGPSGGHKHEQIEEVMYVVSGELSVKLDDEVVELKAGDALRISPETMRAYRNDSGEEAVTAIASPVLPDQKSDGVHEADFWK